MLSLKSNLLIFLSLAIMMIIGTFSCEDLQAGIDYGKYKEKLKQIQIPQIQEQLQSMDELPPDTIAIESKNIKPNGRYVTWKYFTDKMQLYYEEKAKDRARLTKLELYIEERDLYEEGTELQDEENLWTTIKYSTGGTIVMGSIIFIVRNSAVVILTVIWGKITNTLSTYWTGHLNKHEHKKRSQKK